MNVRPDSQSIAAGSPSLARSSFDLPAAVLTGLAMALAFSGKDRFWVAWIALIPALCALFRAGFRRSFAIGAVVGAAMSLGSPWYTLPAVTRQVVNSTWTGIVYMLLLCGFFAVFFGALFLLIRCLIPSLSRNERVLGRLRYILAIACLWVAFEYGYALLLMLTTQIFAMAMGYSQWSHPSIIQLASVGGVQAVSFLIVVFNVAAADDLRRRRFAVSPWVGGFVILCLLGGAFRLYADATGSAAPPRIAVAVLQGNIPAFPEFREKDAAFLAHRYLKLGDLANRVHPDLIIWTETAVPWPLREDDDLVTTMLHVTAPSHAYHILGATIPAPGVSNAFYNSVFLVHPNGDITAQYDKRRLLSFVEKTVRFPFLPAIGVVQPSVRTLLTGTRPPVLDSPLGRIGVFLCNENEYPLAARESAALGAEFLVSPANDFWFREIAQDAPTDWHFAVALFRAVETRRDMVIANNIGISAIVDAFGRILTRSEKGTITCLSGGITRRTGESLYVMVGDLFSQLCACIGLIAVIGALMFAPRTGDAGQTGTVPKTAGHTPKDSPARPQQRQEDRKSIHGRSADLR